MSLDQILRSIRHGAGTISIQQDGFLPVVADLQMPEKMSAAAAIARDGKRLRRDFTRAWIRMKSTTDGQSIPVKG